MTQMLKKIAGFLGSIRVAITLLIIITVVSLFGILIPQDLPYSQYYHKWGAVWGQGLLALGINHVFSTLWFYLLLGLFSCNICVCSMTRIWRNIRNSLNKSFLSSPSAIDKCRHTTTFESRTGSIAAQAAMVQLLKRKRYAFKSQPQGEGFQIAARKGAVKDIGSLVFHMSVIVLFIGGLIGTRFGYSITRELRSGQIISIPDRSFLLRCEWFKLELNEDGSPKDYKSRLAVLSAVDSSTILTKTIEVNAPLSYQGIRFYQSSYGEDSSIANIPVRIFGPEFADTGFSGELAYDVPFQVPNTDLTVRIFDFLPDFTIDIESRVATSRSNQPNNPAVKVVITRGNDTLYDHWAFFRFPDQHASDGPYKVAVGTFEPSYFTGIQIRKNPGVPLIWTGILLMTFGIFVVFYIPKKSLWVFISPRGTGSAIVLGGTSNRAPADFQTEFDTLGSHFKATLNREV